MIRRELPSADPRPEPVAVEVIGEEGEVEYHFPVEIHMEESPEPLDLQRIAEHVYDRLARRLSDKA